MSNDDFSEINIIYNIDDENIKIFGHEFVENNKQNYYLLINSKNYDICDIFNIDKKENKKKLIIKLIENKNVKNISYMFSGCSSLSSLPDISNWNTNNVTNMSSMFYGCSSLSSLPDISNWNTNNVTNMSYLFY